MASRYALGTLQKQSAHRHGPRAADTCRPASPTTQTGTADMCSMADQTMDASSLVINDEATWKKLQ
jgi:hypothetical protein